jgi:hypothetical protein
MYNNRVEQSIRRAQSIVDVPPELPKPPDPLPKSPVPVELFAAPKPVLVVEPKPMSREQDPCKRPVRAEVPSSQFPYSMQIEKQVCWEV